jgi:nucleotide-binding universal stress UspA family protein
VDGSEGARTALEFALEEAARRGAAVQVLSALPEADYWATAYGMPPSMLDELGADVERTARDMVDTVVRERGGALADVPVEVRAVAGSPAHVLMSQSRDADLLVLGHRGRGTLRSALLGSVGLQCVMHASVPATVVRTAPHRAVPDDDRDTAPAKA